MQTLQNKFCLSRKNIEIMQSAAAAKKVFFISVENGIWNDCKCTNFRSFSKKIQMSTEKNSNNIYAQNIYTKPSNNTYKI